MKKPWIPVKWLPREYVYFLLHLTSLRSFIKVKDWHGLIIGSFPFLDKTICVLSTDKTTFPRLTFRVMWQSRYTVIITGYLWNGLTLTSQETKHSRVRMNEVVYEHKHKHSLRKKNSAPNCRDNSSLKLELIAPTKLRTVENHATFTQTCSKDLTFRYHFSSGEGTM